MHEHIVHLKCNKKVLPQKTIDKISTKTPGKKKDPVAKVRGRTEED